MGTAFLETVESDQLFLGELIKVSDIVHESAFVEQDGYLLADTVNVHRMSSHEVFNATTDLRPASPLVGTHPCRFALDTLQCGAARRAVGDKRDGVAAWLAALLVNAHDFWDDFTAFFHIEHISLMDVQLGDNVGIVQRCPLDDRAAQQHGIKVGYGRDDSRASHLKGNELQFGAFAFRSEFIGDGPSRRLGGGTQVQLLAQGIDFKHKAIGGNGQLLAFHVPVADEISHRIDAGQDGHHSGLESPLLECHNALVVSRKRQIVTQQEVEHGIQAAASHLGAVLELQCACSCIARIGEQWLLVELALLVEFFKALPR